MLLLGEPIDDAWIPDRWILHGVFRMSWPANQEAWKRDWDDFMSRGLLYGATVDRVLFAGSEVVDFVRETQNCGDGSEGSWFSYPTRASRDSLVAVVPSKRLHPNMAYLVEVNPSWVDRQLKERALAAP